MRSTSRWPCLLKAVLSSAFSGSIRLLQVLEQSPVETHLIISAAAQQTIESETDWAVSDVEKLAVFNYNPQDIGARLASGSFVTDGMLVAPCSIKTLSGIANSYTDNLIVRAADVMLKEKRKLILVPRESPLNLIHLRNMTLAAEAGAIILPPMTAFYFKPRTIADLVNHLVGKVLDSFGIENDLFPRWGG